MASQSIVPPPPVENAFLVTGEISEEEATVMHAWEGTEWHRLRVGHTKLIRDAAVAFGSEYGRLLVPVERRITEFLLGKMYLPQNFTRVAMKRTWVTRDAVSGVTTPVAGEEATWSRGAKCPSCEKVLMYRTSNAVLLQHRRFCVGVGGDEV